MKSIFVDSLYWVAVINPKDQWHDRATQVGKTLAGAHLVTTESVLIEVMNYFGEYGAMFRLRTARLSQTLVKRRGVELIEQTRAAFLAGVELYRERLDKDYSLTDCLSMNVMREHGIAEILTHDHHFTQEGFTILL